MFLMVTVIETSVAVISHNKTTTIHDYKDHTGCLCLSQYHLKLFMDSGGEVFCSSDVVIAFASRPVLALNTSHLGRLAKDEQRMSRLVRLRYKVSATLESPTSNVGRRSLSTVSAQITESNKLGVMTCA